MRRPNTQLMLGISGIIIAIFAILFLTKKGEEGFQTVAPSPLQSNAKESLKPEQISYQLLSTVMKPIRRLTGIITSPTEWKERFTLAQMTPTEIARDYLNKQLKETKKQM